MQMIRIRLLWRNSFHGLKKPRINAVAAKKIDSLFKVLKFGTASKTAVFLFLFHAKVLMFECLRLKSLE